MGALNLGTLVDRRTQFFFHHDRSFEFRKLEIEENSMIKKTGGRMTEAWPLFDGTTLQFDGYKNISADAVTLAHNRDIIWDPFKKIKDDDKPAKGRDLVKTWTSKQAIAAVYRVQNKARAVSKMERMTIYLFIPTVILALAVALKVFLK